MVCFRRAFTGEVCSARIFAVLKYLLKTLNQIYIMEEEKSETTTVPRSERAAPYVP